jgi:mannose/cellobiose epimerase-like protein (N-acyl-D-glucosamine 2-epimerase family)
VIGAAAAARAGFGDALDLRDNAVLQLERFWRPLEGLYADELSRDWSVEQPTRSSTANMHVLEALLALAQNPPTGYEARHFLDRAESIVTRLIHHMARDNDWRIPQRFDAGGQVDLQSGSEHPDDPFDPFGNVVGLDLEWARLILGLRELLGDSAPVWILDAARALYSRAIADGWSAHDGGFVYTTDWHGSPLVRLRMHWVLAEAISAAATLATATGDDRYRADLDRWWQFAADHVIDPSNGSWRHELDARNQPSAVVWQGRPDLYHSAHAALFATGAHGATPLDAAINSRLAQ